MRELLLTLSYNNPTQKDSLVFFVGDSAKAPAWSAAENHTAKLTRVFNNAEKQTREVYFSATEKLPANSTLLLTGSSKKALLDHIFLLSVSEVKNITALSTALFCVCWMSLEYLTLCKNSKKVHNVLFVFRVLSKENLTAIASVLLKSSGTKITMKELLKLNHLFQACKIGLPSEYEEIPQSFSLIAMNEILK